MLSNLFFTIITISMMNLSQRIVAVMQNIYTKLSHTNDIQKFYDSCYVYCYKMHLSKTQLCILDIFYSIQGLNILLVSFPQDRVFISSSSLSMNVKTPSRESTTLIDCSLSAFESFDSPLLTRSAFRPAFLAAT